jgi:hypothetical protein
MTAFFRVHLGMRKAALALTLLLLSLTISMLVQAEALALSASGTTIPPATQIVDSNGGVWTVNSAGVCLLNGVQAGNCNSVQTLLFYQGSIYVGATEGTWWKWNGSGWGQVAGNPASTGASTSGTTIPSATQIVDSTGGVWTVNSAGLCLLNGVQAGNCKRVQTLLWYQGKIYVESTVGTWWEWNWNGGWYQVAGNPEPPPPAPPVNGACGASNGAVTNVAPTSNLCNAGTASAVAGGASGPWTWGCAGSNGGTSATCSTTAVTGAACPKAAAGYADGCSGAPSGTPQAPALLASYSAHRPAWDVAGVDYPVGITSGTTLKDPASGGLPGGCTYSSPTVSCNGSNIVLNGWDFSLRGGLKLSISGSNNTVSNSKFQLYTNCSDPVLAGSVGAGASLTVTKNNFDGGGGTCTNTLVWGTMINLRGGAASVLNVTYNYFLNTPQDVLDVRGPNSGAGFVNNYQFNYFSGQGWQGHPDGYQSCGGNFNKINISFNTYYNPNGVPTQQGVQPFHVEAQCTSAITNSTVAYNTMVTPGACNGGQNYPTGCSVNYDIACKWDSGSNSNTGFSAYGNYIDWSGAIAALSNGYSCTGTTWGSPLPNIDMKTGGSLSP